MQVLIEFPGWEPDVHLKELIYEKFKHLERIYSRILRCVVIVKEDNDPAKKFMVEAQMGVSKKTLFARSHAENPGIALVKVTDGLARQLHRYKGVRREIW